MKHKFGDFFNKRKTLYFVLCIVLVSIFTLTIVYAALNTVLKITGNTEVVASSWDIHLDNINVKSGSVGGVSPKITSSTTATFSTKLTTPGDFYEFSIDVVNDGTIDAMIDSVSKTPTLTENQAKYLNYIVEYENGKSINTKQLVNAGSFVRLRVRVEFRKDLVASDLPTTNDNLTLSFTIHYVQSDDSGSSVLHNGTLKAMVKNGTGVDVGDEICIGNECFYVISSTDNDVTMLAKYNLYVGNMSDGSTITPLENPSGIQNSKAKGWFDGYSSENQMFGTKLFSSTNYWSGTVSNYPTYVYNEKSYLYEYVENYKAYLEELGTNINEARLITYDELVRLGCSGVRCSDAPNWVYGTTYWSGSASDFRCLWSVWSAGEFSYDDRFESNGYIGVRPVITISKNQILGIESKVKPVTHGSLDEIGTVVTIGSEQFYTIGTVGDNVKLLSKYNLHVGSFVDNGVVTPIINPRGIQDETALGYVNGVVMGTVAYSKTNYWSGTVTSYPSYVYNQNSITYSYVENYRDYLETLGVNVEDARLITYDELSNLGCDKELGNCDNAPEWVYRTTYWTGSANSDTSMWRVSSAGLFDDYGGYEYDNVRGVRPVIIISKSEF